MESGEGFSSSCTPLWTVPGAHGASLDNFTSMTWGDTGAAGGVPAESSTGGQWSSCLWTELSPVVGDDVFFSPEFSKKVCKLWSEEKYQRQSLKLYEEWDFGYMSGCFYRTKSQPKFHIRGVWDLGNWENWARDMKGCGQGEQPVPELFVLWMDAVYGSGDCC